MLLECDIFDDVDHFECYVLLFMSDYWERWIIIDVLFGEWLLEYIGVILCCAEHEV